MEQIEDTVREDDGFVSGAQTIRKGDRVRNGEHL
jgi:hypothetical protein